MIISLSLPFAFQDLYNIYDCRIYDVNFCFLFRCFCLFFRSCSVVVIFCCWLFVVRCTFVFVLWEYLKWTWVELFLPPWLWKKGINRRCRRLFSVDSSPELDAKSQKGTYVQYFASCWPVIGISRVLVWETHRWVIYLTAQMVYNYRTSRYSHSPPCFVELNTAWTNSGNAIDEILIVIM